MTARLLLAVIASLIGSASFACTKSFGGAVFDNPAIDLCLPEQVAQTPVEIVDFYATTRQIPNGRQSMQIFAFLESSNSVVEPNLTSAELDQIGDFLFLDEATFSVENLSSYAQSHRGVIGVVQVLWPTNGFSHGVNCAIFQNDSSRLVYCGIIREDWLQEGSYDLFKPFVDSVIFPQ